MFKFNKASITWWGLNLIILLLSIAGFGFHVDGAYNLVMAILWLDILLSFMVYEKDMLDTFVKVRVKLEDNVSNILPIITVFNILIWGLMFWPGVFFTTIVSIIAWMKYEGNIITRKKRTNAEPTELSDNQEGDK